MLKWYVVYAKTQALCADMILHSNHTDVTLHTQNTQVWYFTLIRCDTSHTSHSCNTSFIKYMWHFTPITWMWTHLFKNPSHIRAINYNVYTLSVEWSRKEGIHWKVKTECRTTVTLLVFIFTSSIHNKLWIL